MPRKLKELREFLCIRCQVIGYTKYDHQRFCSTDCNHKFKKETYEYKVIEPFLGIVSAAKFSLGLIGETEDVTATSVV